jgi:hypothetical protein
VIRRPTSAEVGLVGQQQKASLESAEWAKEIYHGSTNEPRACPGTPCVRPHIARGGGWARARRPGAQPRAGEARTLQSDGRLEGYGRTGARRQRRGRHPRGGLLLRGDHGRVRLCGLRRDRQDRCCDGLRGEGAGAASSAAPAAKTPLSGSSTTAGDTWSTSGGQDTSPPDDNAGARAHTPLED